MARKRYPPAVITRVLAEARRGARPLRQILGDHEVPERTYHHWRRRFPDGSEDTLETIRGLQREIRRLRRENERLLVHVALQRELLGKPWRRSPPGGRPSATR